jgi:hypothetical protein
MFLYDDDEVVKEFLELNPELAKELIPVLDRGYNNFGKRVVHRMLCAALEEKYSQDMERLSRLN